MAELFNRRIVCVATVPFFVVTQLGAQIKALLAVGMKVTVVTSSGPELALLCSHPSLSLRLTEIRRDISPLDDWRTLWSLIRIFREENPHIVHSTTPKAGLLVAIAAFIARVPVRLHTFTGQPWLGLTGPKRWIARFADQIIGRVNTACYADSPSQRHFLIKEGLVSESRISVIGEGSLAGVDIERFSAERLNPGTRERIRAELGISEDTLVILYVGRLTVDKGIRELLEAARLLHYEERDFCLLLVGPMDNEAGGKETICREEFDQLSFVHYVGYTPVPEHYMGASDIFCLPSYREGFGTTVIEAAAMGLPTVGSRINGLVDAVADGETGILVEPKNHLALAVALKELLENKELRLRLGRRAHERALKIFAANRVNSALLVEYERLLDCCKS